MATKGAHVFRLRKVELAKHWMRTLNITQYEPSLANLNFDYEPLSEPTDIDDPPQAHIDELPELTSSLTPKLVPDETWQMVRKLSEVLAKSVPRKKTEIPFKFNKCLQVVYEREQTPLPSRSASIASGTRSHDPSNRKRSLDDSSSNPNHDNSPANDDNRRPTKKKRPVEDNRTIVKTPTPSHAPDSEPIKHSNTRERLPTPSPKVHAPPTRTPITFDWKSTIPQALVLDFLPGKQDSHKFGVWFLPSQMVCPLSFFFPISLLSRFLGSQQKNSLEDSLQNNGLHNVHAN